MKTIELSRWEPSPEDPHVEVCAGQRPAQEVFEELKYRLESIGYLKRFLINYNFFTNSARMALRTAMIITPTSANTASHILAKPRATSTRQASFTPMATTIF